MSEVLKDAGAPVVGDALSVRVEHVDEMVVVRQLLILRKESRFPATHHSSDLTLRGLTRASKIEKMKCLAVLFVAGKNIQGGWARPAACWRCL